VTNPGLKHKQSDRPALRISDQRLTVSVPDANKIWTFREALKKANAIDGAFQRFDAALRDAGCRR
jgi:hypothetical protein